MAEINGVQLLFKKYIEELTFTALLSPSTIRGYQATFELFCKLMPEIDTLAVLTPSVAIEFFRRLQTRSRAAAGIYEIKSSTIKTYWGKLNAFFQWLMTNGYIQQNPLERVKPPKPVFGDHKALAEDEIHKLYAALTINSRSVFCLRRDTVILSLFLFCGVRHGEFIALEPQDVDLDKRLLQVRSNTSKARKTRFVPLHPILVMHLKDYFIERNKRASKSQYLILSSTTDSRLTKHGLKHWVNILRHKSGVRFHLHQFRHTFACNLARKNVNAVKIQRLLGHSSLDMTMTYLRSMGTEDMHDDIGLLSL